MKESPKKILIVGGTGMLGKELVRQLLPSGDVLHVMTRTPEKYGEFRQSGVHVIGGDLIDKSSLLDACSGMDVVVATAHAILGRGKYSSESVDRLGHKSLINAAKETGVKYFFYTSGIGAQLESPIDFWRSKAEVEAFLIESGMPYNIIRPAAFMERHIKEFIGKPILEKGMVLLFGKGEAPCNFVSVRDVAGLIKYCIDHPELRNMTFDFGGLDNVSRSEIVSKYAASANKKVKVIHVPLGAVKVMSRLIKPFHPGISRILFMSQLLETGDYSFDVRPLLNKIPIQITRIDDFIRDG